MRFFAVESHQLTGFARLFLGIRDRDLRCATERREGTDAKRPRQPDELEDVHAPGSPLDVGDPLLCPAEFAGQCALGYPHRFPAIAQERDQLPVVVSMDRLGQGGSPFRRATRTLEPVTCLHENHVAMWVVGCYAGDL